MATSTVLSLVSLGVSIIAVLLSSVNLWKTYFSKFLPVTSSGRLRMRIYPILNGIRKWYIVSFDLPFAVANNNNALPGIITYARLALSFPESECSNYREYIYSKFLIEPEKANQISKDRFTWIDTIDCKLWTPIIVLSKQIVKTHIIFEKRWDKPIIQEKVKCDLEIQISGKGRWKKVNSWDGYLGQNIWLNNVKMGIGSLWTDISTPFRFLGDPMPKEIESILTEEIDFSKTFVGSPPSFLDYEE